MGDGLGCIGFEESWSWALAHVCTNNPKSLTWSYLTLLLCMRCSSPWLHWAGLGSTWLGWIWVGLCWAKLCCARLATKTQVSDGDWRPNRRRTSEQRTPESLRGRPVVAPLFLGSRATWSPRGRSVGALWWWALCLFNSVREVGLGGFSRPRARSFSRSQGKPRVGLV